MKLTETKLKQLILESIGFHSGGTSDHYNKLTSLMETEEGFNQAQSLFEMIEGTLVPKERTELRSYFDVIDLAKEVRSLKLEKDAAQEKYNKIEAKLLKGAPIDAEADRAFSKYIRADNAHYKAKKELDRRMIVMPKHGKRKIYDVVNSMVSKILKGKI